MQDFTYQSLDPVPVTAPGAAQAAETRTFQGIPGIARAASGRLFATWYTGGNGECRDNYVCLCHSDDDGATWSATDAVVAPPHPAVRAFDPTLWTAPDGRVMLFWAQGCSETGLIYDGIAGVWFAALENPDATPADFRFSPSVRVCNGIMLNKPTVLSDGTWAMPASLWSFPRFLTRRHDSLGVVPGAYLVASTDGGRSFDVRGRIEMHGVESGPEFDEHSFFECADGAIVCHLRVTGGIAESTSRDGGRTWSRPMLAFPGPHARFFLTRLPSGRLLRVWHDSPDVRVNLTAWLSEDDGRTWAHPLLIDGRPSVSYPDGCLAPDGAIHLIYDRERYHGGYIYHARFTEEDILAGRRPAITEVSHSRPIPEPQQ